MGIPLTPEERFEVFGEHDPAQYEAEVEQRWGETDAFAESRRRTASYTKDDWLRIKEEGADLERRFAAALRGGVPADSLLAVPVGVDTLESMRAVGAAFRERGWSTAVLVTDPWHAMRAERMADDSGLQAQSSPTRQGPAVETRNTQFLYIVRETAAYLVYRVTGRSVTGAPGIR